MAHKKKLILSSSLSKKKKVIKLLFPPDASIALQTSRWFRLRHDGPPAAAGTMPPWPGSAAPAQHLLAPSRAAWGCIWHTNGVHLKVWMLDDWSPVVGVEARGVWTDEERGHRSMGVRRGREESRRQDLVHPFVVVPIGLPTGWCTRPVEFVKSYFGGVNGSFTWPYHNSIQTVVAVRGQINLGVWLYRWRWWHVEFYLVFPLEVENETAARPLYRDRNKGLNNARDIIYLK